jgi:hypothetical protein
MSERITIEASTQLVQQMADEWSPPVQCKLVKQDDGTYEMWFRITDISTRADLEAASA